MCGAPPFTSIILIRCVDCFDVQLADCRIVRRYVAYWFDIACLDSSDIDLLLTILIHLIAGDTSKLLFNATGLLEAPRAKVKFLFVNSGMQMLMPGLRFLVQRFTAVVQGARRRRRETVR